MASVVIRRWWHVLLRRRRLLLLIYLNAVAPDSLDSFLRKPSIYFAYHGLFLSPILMNCSLITPLLLVFANLSLYTRGLDALTLKVGSYASKVTVDQDILVRGRT